MAKSGVNTKVARKAYNAVQDDLLNLEKHINQLKTDVEALNKNSWYGGTSSAKWYGRVVKVYANLVSFHGSVTKFQNALYQQFHKSTAKGIEF